MQNAYSRRSFIAGSIAAGTTLYGASAFAAEAAGGDLPAQWDETQQIVIIGAGAAGLAAAIEAYDNGVTPLVLESQPIIGGDTRVNAGYIAGNNTRLAKELGVVVTDEEVKEWSDSLYATTDIYTGDPEPDVLEIVNTRAGETVDWLEEKGVVFENRIGLEKDYCPLQVYHYSGGGYLIISALKDVVDADGIEVRVNARANKLYMNDDGRVVGVRVAGEDGEYTIGAEKAVIIATGGYTANKELLYEMVPSIKGCNVCVAEGAQGDGLIMAMEIGAQARRLSELPMFLAAIEVNSGLTFMWSALDAGGFAVDHSGKRFINENHDYVNGEVTREIFGHFQAVGEDTFYLVVNDDEVVEGLIDLFGIPRDVLYYADDIAGIAEAIGLDAAVLAETAEAYNAACESGEDPDFGRTEDLVPLAGKLVAAEVQPRAITTTGGLRTDGEARVLRYAPIGSESPSEPIPGLYAAGEVAQWNARGGYFQSMCYTMGRIAGRNAVAE